MKISFRHYPLQFIRPAGTSRGIMNVKNSWILTIDHAGKQGIGEISVLEGLSAEFIDFATFEKDIAHFTALLEDHFSSTKEVPEWHELTHLFERLVEFPSILFGFETALLDWTNGGQSIIFDNQFSRGKQNIPINGLIWMGDEQSMQAQIEQKLADGFTTIKMKIGAIDFETELSLLKYIRNRFSSSAITLRVDANGAFDFNAAKSILSRLAQLDIHSIEQPIKAGQIDNMKRLCATSEIPIALDEELIGLNHLDEKIFVLEMIQPQYIILKPSLHGGISGTKEWIQLAEERGIQWWITSALESNIGLNAICQLVGEYDNRLPQGLGTGSLYHNNTPSALTVENGYIFLKDTF
jgi:o-succinylbenzoate synthase